MALLDLHPEWVLPDLDTSTGLCKAVTASQIERGMKAATDVKAVYVTSPNYFGVTADIDAISQVCRAWNIPLLVDNAHGAHLRFFSPNRHPIALGADLCCDSLHKTMPVLTGGAILHVGDARYARTARQKLSLFGSTSPSYLVLASMDAAVDYLISLKAAEQMQKTAERLGQIARVAKDIGYLLPVDVGDPLRLTVSAAGLGYTGSELAGHLRAHRIEPEYAGESHLVLMASPLNTPEDFTRLENALCALPVREPIIPAAVAATLPQRVLSVREALFAQSETLPVESAVGRVACSLISPCPPGIALACPGERIDDRLAQVLKSSGISCINVVK